MAAQQVGWRMKSLSLAVSCGCAVASDPGWQQLAPSLNGEDAEEIAVKLSRSCNILRHAPAFLMITQFLLLSFYELL